MPEIVEGLVGMQAQATMPPYYGLWSRIEAFDAGELGRLLTERELVRITLMRCTIHLVTVRDAAFIRPLVQSVVERLHNAAFGRRMGRAEPAAVAAAAVELLADGPLGARELGRRLVERGIGEDAEAVGNATRIYAPLVQVPPRGVWGKGGRALYQPFERWTGRELDSAPSRTALVRRYLAAFGPASVMDAQNWSGLTKLRDAFEELRPRLVTFRDEDEVELFDLPDAPRPDAEVEAPVRLLGEYDNVLLGHADRRRIIPDGYPWTEVFDQRRFVNNLLVDGMLRGVWWIEKEGRSAATLAIQPWRGLTADERDRVETEAARMLEFAAGGADERGVRFDAPL